MYTTIDKTAEAVKTRPFTRTTPVTRVSRGGIDEINPEDIVYGEYASGDSDYGTWIDLVYLDDDILRTYSGSVDAHHPVIEELKILLRSEEVFYLVLIREVELGFAFKRTDILDIKTMSTIQGNAKHAPSCVWEMLFKDRAVRTLEAEYQSYFAYGNTIRPANMSNETILAKIFVDDSKGRK